MSLVQLFDNYDAIINKQNSTFIQFVNETHYFKEAEESRKILNPQFMSLSVTMNL